MKIKEKWTNINKEVEERLEVSSHPQSWCSYGITPKLQQPQKHNYKNQPTITLKYQSNRCTWFGELIDIMRVEHIYWLFVCQRIDFKIALLVYKGQNGPGQKHIFKLLVRYEAFKSHRSAPRAKTKHDEAALSFYAPHLFKKMCDLLQLSTLLNQGLNLFCLPRLSIKLKQWLFICALSLHYIALLLFYFFLSYSSTFSLLYQILAIIYLSLHRNSTESCIPFLFLISF